MPRRGEAPRCGPGPRGTELSSRAGPRHRRWGVRGGGRTPERGGKGARQGHALPPPAPHQRPPLRRGPGGGARPAPLPAPTPLLPFLYPWQLPAELGAPHSPGHGSISLRPRPSPAEPPPPAENAPTPSLPPGLATADRRLATAEAPAPHPPSLGDEPIRTERRG